MIEMADAGSRCWKVAATPNYNGSVGNYDLTKNDNNSNNCNWKLKIFDDDDSGCCRDTLGCFQWSVMVSVSRLAKSNRADILITRSLLILRDGRHHIWGDLDTVQRV